MRMSKLRHLGQPADLLDFLICSRVNSGQITVAPTFDLSSDHSPIIAVLHRSIQLNRFPRFNTDKFKNEVRTRIRPLVSSLETGQELEEETANLMKNLERSMNASIIPETQYNSHASQLIRNKIKEKRNLKRIYQHTLHPSDKTNINRASNKL